MTSKKRLSLPSLTQQGLSIDQLNKYIPDTLMEQLGIQFTVLKTDYLQASMPVDRRTIQPMGLLHGGASVALAETLGSVSSSLCIDPKTTYCVGLEINANHIKKVYQGYVTGTSRPIHIGRKTHLWEIRITDEEDNLIAISRITMAILEKS